MEGILVARVDWRGPDADLKHEDPAGSAAEALPPDSRMLGCKG